VLITDKIQRFYIDVVSLDLRFPIAEISAATGFNKSNVSEYLSKKKIPSEKFLNEFYKKFSSIIVSLEETTNILNEPGEEYTISPIGKKRKLLGTGLVKFYDTDFAAGDVQFYEDNNTIVPAYEMDIPEFAGCTAFRSYGDSMEPMIKSGSILFGTAIVDWASHLEYGQIYGIVCIDNRKYLKYIRKDKEQPHTQFLLRSENKEYDDFEIPKNKIKAIWLIHGWINKKA
jgi:phage repressor protein C with HTH and peptisase S24 domain